MKRLSRDSYLTAINNSVGSDAFRRYYARIHGKKVDVLRGGELSCAFHVSSILSMFRYIRRPHTTVNGTLHALGAVGWKRIRKPRKGAILVWAEKKFKDGDTHRHIGFYVGNSRAVSNSFKARHPVSHHWTFRGKRNVELILWHSKLN
ncbi:hypothetical protein HY414_02375 [Candidatus Kaiserbacteria bacterium]|nr:hypothetical protein [Candidatus Kaiserbacteria bacterium]